MCFYHLAQLEMFFVPVVVVSFFCESVFFFFFVSLENVNIWIMQSLCEKEAQSVT